MTTDTVSKLPTGPGSIEPRLVYLTAWVALLDMFDKDADAIEAANKDLKVIKKIVSSSDGAWRLSQDLHAIGLTPDQIPGLEEMSK